MLGIVHLVFGILSILFYFGDDFREIERFQNRFSLINNFQTRASGQNGEVVFLTYIRSKNGHLFSQLEVGESHESERRSMWNPHYLANVEKRDGQWHLSSVYDNKSEAHRSESRAHLLFFTTVFPPKLIELLNPKEIERVVKVSPHEIEYYISPDSKFFIPIKGCEKVTIKYAQIGKDFLPVSVEAWVDFGSSGSHKPAKYVTTVNYSDPELLPVKVEQRNTQAELGVDVFFDFEISSINPNDFPWKNDCYLSAYGLPEPKGFSRRLSWTAWLAILIVIAISLRFLWHLYSKNSK